MKVLLLGGTGAMGMPLQQQCVNRGFEVYVTSRTKRNSGKINYLCGNAKDTDYLKQLFKSNYDVIVDFMSYKTNEFRDRANLLLEHTAQYIFLSSARVYSPAEGPINESQPRLLDVCEDKDYLLTDDYALTKARQEDILQNSSSKNWTILRPSLTYNTNRLQYAIGEKEEWLYRYLHGEKIIFPQNLSDIYTTMSCGNDVAKCISLLIGNRKAYGEAINIAGANNAITWGEVNDIYSKTLERKYLRSPQFVYIDDWKQLGRSLGKYYQIQYARSVNRRFDNTKLNHLIGDVPFVSPVEGLEKCLNEFLDGKQAFKNISWKAEAYYNRLSKDKEIPPNISTKQKIKYYIIRYAPGFMNPIMRN